MNKKGLIKYFVLSFAILLLQVKPLQGQDLFFEKKDRHTFSNVKFVYDGDTIKLSNDQKVRYIGIDTPETEHSKKGYQPFSGEATAFNKKLVLNKKIQLEFDVEKRDKYGRLLAYVFVDDVFVNAKLIEEGFARVYTFPPNIKYQELFLELQKKAKKQKKGIWAV